MADIGEELVGAWLRLIGECDFVQYNIPLRDRFGEIDVIGINFERNNAYICEVATHLDGIAYTDPNNVEKLTKKFQSDAEYARNYLQNFQHHFMLWSPVVTHPKSDTAKTNQFRDLIAIRKNMWDSDQIEIEMIINETYLDRVNEMRERARRETSQSGFPVYRLLQIFEHLEAHVDRLRARGIDSVAVINDGMD